MMEGQKLHKLQIFVISHKVMKSFIWVQLDCENSLVAYYILVFQLDNINSDDGKTKPTDVHIRMPRIPAACPPGSPSLRLALVVLSIGAASHFLVRLWELLRSTTDKFQLFLDSVVDNLLPAAMPFFLSVYENKENGKTTRFLKCWFITCPVS